MKRAERLTKFRERIHNVRGVKEKFENLLTGKKKVLKSTTKELVDSQIAQRIIQVVAKETQSQLEYSISEMSTLALKTVFDDPYRLVVEFTEFGVQRTECKMFFERDDYEFEPGEETGGGAEEVAEFSLRPAAFMVGINKCRNVLLADEPFIKLKGEEANIRALQLLQKISRELNLQIIMVSDERVSRELILQNTDRLFLVEKDGNKSVITTFEK